MTYTTSEIQLEFVKRLNFYYIEVLKECPDDMMRNTYIKLQSTLLDTHVVSIDYVKKRTFLYRLKLILERNKYSDRDKDRLNACREMILNSDYPFHKWKEKKKEYENL